MPDSEVSRMQDLDCLRLASDLTQLASGEISPGLRDQLLQMATALTRQAESGPDADSPERP
jgi:hypothetical protein